MVQPGDLHVDGTTRRFGAPLTCGSSSTALRRTYDGVVREVEPAGMDLSQLGATTGGVWTTTDAVAAGLTREQVRRRLERGQWQRLRRGVMTDGGVRPDAPMRGWAAVMAAGGPGHARVTGRSTVRLLGLPLIDDEDPATGAYDLVHDDVAVLPGVHLRQRPTLHVSALSLRAGDRVRISGCPSLSLRRSLPLLARVLTHEALVCALDAALRRELLDGQQLMAVLDRQAGQPGCAVLRRAVAAADARAESPAETLARLLLLPVLPRLEPQVRLRDAGGRILARFDLGDRTARLAVEADGKRGHAGAAMAAKDHRRDRTTAALGWTTERCTWWELRRDQAALQRRVVATADRLARRAA